MPENNLSSQVTAGGTERGRIRINVLSSLGQFPISDASVSISANDTPGNIFMQLSTDVSGLTETVELPTPALTYSMQPESAVKPYAEVSVTDAELHASGQRIQVNVQMMNTKNSIVKYSWITKSLYSGFI